MSVPATDNKDTKNTGPANAPVSVKKLEDTKASTLDWSTIFEIFCLSSVGTLADVKNYVATDKDVTIATSGGASAAAAAAATDIKSVGTTATGKIAADKKTLVDKHTARADALKERKFQCPKKHDMKLAKADETYLYYQCNLCGQFGHATISPRFFCEDKSCEFDMCITCASLRAQPIATGAAVTSDRPAFSTVMRDRRRLAVNDDELKAMEAGDVFNGQDVVILISDLHIASKWFRDDHQKSLLAFIAYLKKEAKKGNINGLVILGDAFETWSIDERYRFDKTYIEEKAKFFTDAIVDLTTTKVGTTDKTVKVVYVMGNHDDVLSETDIRKMFKNKIMYVPAWYQWRITLGPEPKSQATILMEHGHRYDLFNTFETQKADAKTPHERRPLGYYLTRADYSRGVDQTVSFFAKAAMKVSDAVPQDAFRGLILHFARQKIEPPVQRIALPEGDTESFNTAIEAACNRAHSWFHDSASPVPLSAAAALANSDPGSVIATQYHKQTEDVVIYGHFHRPQVRSLPNWGEPLVYANTGSWGIDSHDIPTFIKLSGRTATLDLFSWQQNQAVNQTSQEMPAKPNSFLGSLFRRIYDGYNYELKPIATTPVYTKGPRVHKDWPKPGEGISLVHPEFAAATAELDKIKDAEEAKEKAAKAAAKK